MDGFELMLPLTGPAPLTFEVVGEVTVEEVLATKSTTSAVARLTGRHHALARLIAGGSTQIAAADVVGIHVGTVGRLMTDPAFQNLVDFYKKSEDEVFYSTQERLSSVTNLALDRLEEKLTDDEVVKKMTPGQILEIAIAGADRTGNGPSQTNVNMNVNANLADRMKKAREDAMNAMRDVTPAQAAE